MKDDRNRYWADRPKSEGKIVNEPTESTFRIYCPKCECPNMPEWVFCSKCKHPFIDNTSFQVFLQAQQAASSALMFAILGLFLIPFSFVAFVKISLASSLVPDDQEDQLQHLEEACWVAGVGIFVWIFGVFFVLSQL